MPVMDISGNVKNESGKVQTFYRGVNLITVEPNGFAPRDVAFLPDGAVHPSLLPPPAERKRTYKYCGCAKDQEDE